MAVTVKKALKEAARIAREVARKTTLGPCDTYHNCETAGSRIADAIDAYSRSVTAQEK